MYICSFLCTFASETNAFTKLIKIWLQNKSSLWLQGCWCPQALVSVFGKAFTWITRHLRQAVQHGHRKRVAVVTHGSPAIGRYPYEALAIGKYLVDVVMRKSCCQIQTGNVIPVRQHILCCYCAYQQVSWQVTIDRFNSRKIITQRLIYGLSFITYHWLLIV